MQSPGSRCQNGSHNQALDVALSLARGVVGAAYAPSPVLCIAMQVFHAWYLRSCREDAGTRLGSVLMYLKELRLRCCVGTNQEWPMESMVLGSSLSVTVPGWVLAFHRVSSVLRGVLSSLKHICSFLRSETHFCVLCFHLLYSRNQCVH